jgi:uncharacterized protein (TIGR00255 family)
MLRSMTGYGRAEKTVGEKTYLIEIRSLNGKQFEMLIKLPGLLKPYEFEIRQILSEQLIRGSVDCSVTLKQNGASKPVVINTELIKAYHQQLTELSDKLQMDTSQLLSALLKLPEVVVPATEVIGDNEFNSFKEILLEAIAELNKHRINEGDALEKDLRLRIQQIRKQQEVIAVLEPRRQVMMREGLLKLLEDKVGKDNFDANRLEQELIYYIEKIDISEEQVRLTNHCDYFESILDEPEISKGKKLSFVLQEIGREINTTGAKAYDAEIQKSVVLMKDELEKAKEQVLNIL